MAGIAFRLQKLLSGESLSDLVRAYLYSAIISTGPFLIVIITLAAIKTAVQVRLPVAEGNYLLSLIVYVFAFTMIGVSPFIYVATRYLADQYYLKNIASFAPCYQALLMVIFTLQSVVALPYLYRLDLVLPAKWVLFCLYLFVSGIWIAMIFLSAARNYMGIVVAFAVGGVVGIGAAWLGGDYFGFVGFLTGLTLGQGACFTILTLRIFQEFGFGSFYNFGFFAYFKKHPYLVFIGIFYYLGVWVDKFVFWFSPVGEPVANLVKVYTDYDMPMFLAYLTVTPAMAFFLVQMETSFVREYHAYFEAIRKRGSLSSVQRQRKKMIEVLSNHFQKYALFQGIISGVVILALLNIAEAFQLNPYQMGILRISILGAFLHMGLLMVLTIVFYFDFQKEAFIMVFLFLVTNATFTLATLRIGYQAFGFGYATASFVTVLVSFLILNGKLKNLDYWILMKQPILVPRYKLESELAFDYKIEHAAKIPPPQGERA